jgi:hypothetical protein
MTHINSEPVITCPDGRWRGDWNDGYAVIVKDLDMPRVGVCRAEVEVQHHNVYVNTLAVDLLSSRSREEFTVAMGARNGVPPAVWDERLGQFYRNLRAAQKTAPAHSPWTQGVTAEDFLLQEDPDVQADVKDLVIPGCITVMAAPRASGKSLVALYIALVLATGGVFRGERVPQRRVALVDRDNPPALIRKRLRWLGAQKVRELTVFSRDVAPPLTDANAWATFPVDRYDVLIVDSIGAATEGVSEKEGRQTQEYLATLKDLARCGPAILALDNTNKAAVNYRGRGEKADAVDILYECRNITGWTPSHAGDWWEDLPDCGEHAWQQRASRRKGQQVLRLAFVPSKYRLAAEPEPFALEIDTRHEPWTLTDVTEDIATAGERAAEEASRQDRVKIAVAEEMLVQAITARAADTPLLKSEAEALLRACGLRQRVARTLLESGGNHDIYPAGRWVIRQLPHHPTGKALGVYLVGKEDCDKRSNVIAFPSKDALNSDRPFVNGSTPDDEGSTSMIGAVSLEKTSTDLSSQPGDSMTKGNPLDDEQLRGSLDAGGPFVMHSDSSALSDERSTGRVCPQCGCDALMHCATYLKCPVCSIERG